MKKKRKKERKIINILYELIETLVSIRSAIECQTQAILGISHKKDK